MPDVAIGTEQIHKFVLVVDSSNTAREKYVTLGQTTPDGLRVIKDGIGPDDRVVVSGLMQARAGQKVKPQAQAAKTAKDAAKAPPSKAD